MEPLVLEVAIAIIKNLGDRWRLYRNSKIIDLTNETQDDNSTSLESLLHEISQEIDEDEIIHRIEMIKARRKLIRTWEKNKLSNEKAHTLGQMTLAIFEANQLLLNEKIENAQREIEADLKVLGIETEKI